MQHQIWTRSQVQSECQGLKHLGEVLEHYEAKLWKKGYVVCSIFVNGMRLSEEDEQRFSKSPVNEIKELKLVYAPPSELIQETIRSASDWVPKIKETSIQIADLFREGSVEEAHHQIGEVLESCRWLSDALHQIKTSSLDWAEVEVSNQNWKAIEKEFSETVKQILDAYEQKDIVLLGDILEYELSNCLDGWQNVLVEAENLVVNHGKNTKI